MSIDQAQYYLRVTDDKLQLLLDCDLDSDVLESPDRIEKLIEGMEREIGELNVAEPPTLEALQALIEEAAKSDGVLRGSVLAEGKEPVQPIDGALEWGKDFFSTDFVVDPVKGTVDYRKPKACLSVKEDEYLARVGDPVPGQPGADIHGKVLKVPSPRKSTIHAGQNVRRDEIELGIKFFAAMDGRVRWRNGTLSVEAVYQIQGNVGLATGNVEHPGSLEISEDIQAASSVEAEGDIKVRGVIEAADVTTHGNLIVGGGIIGGPDHIIKASGEVKARFIKNAVVEAGGDITVESEIVNSIVRTRGSIIISGGRIVESEVKALGGILVGQAGNKGVSPTLLVAGEDFALPSEIEQHNDRINELLKDLEKVIDIGKPLSVRESYLTPSQAKDLANAREKMGKLKEEIKARRAEIDACKERSRESANGKIVIMNEIYTDVIMRVNGVEHAAEGDFKGPLRAVLADGKLKLRGERKGEGTDGGHAQAADAA